MLVFCIALVEMTSLPKEGSKLGDLIQFAAQYKGRDALRLGRSALPLALGALGIAFPEVPLVEAPGVDLSTLPLLSPNIMETTPIIGVPDALSVVVMLLFVGSQCVDCERVLSLLWTFFQHANAFEHQVEIILVSAHRTAGEFRRVLFNLRNPFFAVPYDSPVRERLLRDFNVDYAADGSFEAKLVFLEWLGARNQAAVPTFVARQCHTIRNTTGFVAELHLPEIRLPVSVKTRRTSFKIPRPAEYLSTTVVSNDNHFPPVDRVQTIREHCSFFFEDLRDTLHGMKRGAVSIERLAVRQWKFVQALAYVTDRLTAAAPDASMKALAVYNHMYERVKGAMSNERLLVAMGATPIVGASSGRMREPPVMDLGYFQTFLARLHLRLVPFMRSEYVVPFPALKTHAVEAPMYEIVLQFHTRRWVAVRDRFPATSAELRDIFTTKIFGDKYFNGANIRMFSEELNPHVADVADECDLNPEGLTSERGGSVRYDSLSEIQPQLDAAREKSANRQLVRINVVAICPMSRFAGKPATDKEAVMSKIEEMLAAAAKIEFAESPWLREAMLSAAIVAKLAELDPYQEEMLRRVNVPELHAAAMQDLYTYAAEEEALRQRLIVPATVVEGPAPSGGDSTPEIPMEGSFKRTHPRSLSEGESLPDGTRLEYPEALLRQMVKWFNEKYFTWLPGLLNCVSDPRGSCPGLMQMQLTRLNKNQETDDMGRAIEPGLFRAYITERFKCRRCQHMYTLLRPVHDLMRIIEFPQGRCGEHGKAFALFARAMGFDARIVVGKFRERDPSQSIGFFGAGDTDHLWNEVFIEERGEWVHVDVTASDDVDVSTGSLGIPKSKRYNSPDAFVKSAGSLLIAAAVCKDSAALVTAKYLDSSADALYAAHQQDDAVIRTDVEALSRVISETSINEPTNEPIVEDIGFMRQQYVRQRDEVERVQLDGKFWVQGAPKVGLGSETVRGPGGIQLFVVGGAIADWASRLRHSLFQSYDALMSMDSMMSWRVCRVEVAKVGGLVARVLFRYCVGGEAEPSTWSVTEDDFGLEEEDLPPLAADAVVTTTVIPRGDWIALVDTNYNVEGLLSDFTLLLGSEMAGHGDDGIVPRSVVGFYGARKHPARIGFDFMGFYMVPNGPRSPGISPAISRRAVVPLDL